MRRRKIEARDRGKAVKHTRAEKLHLSRVKKQTGGCGKRRAERRKALQPVTLACGCVRGRYGMTPCAEHAAGTPVEPDSPLDYGEVTPEAVETMILDAQIAEAVRPYDATQAEGRVHRDEQSSTAVEPAE